MSLSVWFWLFMALWLILGIYRDRAQADPWLHWGGSLLTFLLFAIVGWKVFGSPIGG